MLVVLHIVIVRDLPMDLVYMQINPLLRNSLGVGFASSCCFEESRARCLV